MILNPLLFLDFKDRSNLKVGVDYSYLIDRHEDDGTKTLNYILDGNYQFKETDMGAWAFANFCTVDLRVPIIMRKFAFSKSLTDDN